MTKEDVVYILEANGVDYTILDDVECDPIEIVIIMQAIPKELKKVGQRLMFCGDEDRKRIIVFQTYKEAGLSCWYNKICKRKPELSCDDIAFLWLHMAYCLSERDSWLKWNIIYQYMKRFQTGKEAVEDFYVSYTLKNSVIIRHINNTIYSKQIGNRIVWFSKVLVSIYKKICLFKMRVYYKYKYYRLSRDKNHSCEAFVARLISDNVTTECIDNHDRKAFSSSSGGNFFIYKDGDSEYFIKGNEPEPIKSIKNEAIVQQIIMESEEDKECFVLMNRHADDCSWIEYPYIPYDTLNDFLKTKQLDDGSVKKLGVFLCRCVDILYKLNIVHNDLRDTNIMVFTDDCGNVTDFRLIDFGAASIYGKSPWNINIYEGKYLIKNVCGDYRYNESVLDDAASAMLVYFKVGGSADDEAAKILRSKIGRLYYSIDTNCNGQI